MRARTEKREKREEMYRKALIWNLVFLLGLLYWGSVSGQLSTLKIRKTIGGNSFLEALTIDNHLCVIKNSQTINFYNPKGNLMWTTTIASSLVVGQIYNSTSTIDTGILVLMTNVSSYNGIPTPSDSGLAYCVLKYDKQGNHLWSSIFYTNYAQANQTSTRLIEHYDGSIYIVMNGDSSRFSRRGVQGYGKEDYHLLKLNSLGVLNWIKSYGGSDRDWVQFCRSGIDSSVWLGGFSWSPISGNKSVALGTQGMHNWYINVDKNGNIKSQKIFPLMHTYYGSSPLNSFESTKDTGFIVCHSDTSNVIAKLDKHFNVEWTKTLNNLNFGLGGPMRINHVVKQFKNNYYGYACNDLIHIIFELDSAGNLKSKLSYYFKLSAAPKTYQDIFNIHVLDTNALWICGQLLSFPGEMYSLSNLNGNNYKSFLFGTPLSSIKGSVFPDFNSNCTYNKSSEYNIPNVVVYNKAENNYAVSNDSIYTVYIFDRDTAVLKIINLDSNLYTACGKDSIVVNMTGKKDTSGIDFPIRSNKAGHCINITAFSSGITRLGSWGQYQLNYQNNAFDTAYSAYIEIEIDTAAIDSIKSPYSFTMTGNILRINLGHIRPFGFSSLSYSIKLKTTVINGSIHCHRAKVFPICNLYPNTVYDSSEIQPMMRCLPNDTVEFSLKNIGAKDQRYWGLVKSYEDIIIFKTDSFKLNKGDRRIWKFRLDSNKVYTAEVFNSNFHPVTPILIRHNDICANKRPMIPSNPALNFSRHDEAKEYEEACALIRGSYDPNIKSVQPVGMFTEHYTSTGTELKYRIDFQNMGTDTAFRVVLIDTLSSFLNIASFVPGVSSHPYSIEFGGRAVKFIFDPIRLIDSRTNEPASHGYVNFKIKHIQGITPKTKIENKADIYFDYNAYVRTNTVFNTIFDTIQIYVPKAKDTTTKKDTTVEKDTTGGKDTTNSILDVDQGSVLIFPNPTTDKFVIQMSEPVKDLTIEIYDVRGRMMKAVSSSNDITIEVSAQGMSKGIYSIRCMSGEKLIVVKKVMVE